MARQHFTHKRLDGLHTVETLASFQPDEAPRANVDPITDERDLLALAALVLGPPLEQKTLVVILDDHRRGRCLITVTGTDDPDDVIEVAHFIRDAVDLAPREAPPAIALVSVRPDAPVDPDDADRRDEIAQILGPVRLDEWLVLGEWITRVPATAVRSDSNAIPPL